MVDRREGNNINMNNIVVYLLVVIALGLGTWSFSSTSEHQAQLKALESLPSAIEKLDGTLDKTNSIVLRMDERVKSLENETERDERQDASIKRQWELYSDIKDRLIKLEAKVELWDNE
jgi:predicted nuclease with TOPRIM domain